MNKNDTVNTISMASKSAVQDFSNVLPGESIKRKVGAKRPSVYIAGPLTCVENPAMQRRFYESIAVICKRQSLDPYLPHLKTDPALHPKYTPHQVYEINRGKIEKAALLIAYVGMPSLGTGAELEIANQHRIPIILLFEKGKQISRQIMGIPSVAKIIKFSGHRDCLRKLSKLLPHVGKKGLE